MPLKRKESSSSPKAQTPRAATASCGRPRGSRRIEKTRMRPAISSVSASSANCARHSGPSERRAEESSNTSLFAITAVP